MFFIASYTIINSGGNQVGDCNLLLSVISIFLVYNWTRKYQDNIIEHPWKYAYLWFILCIMSTFSPNKCRCHMRKHSCYSQYIAFHKKWNNLIKNGIAFITGCCTFVLPFIIYFNIHNALSDMWYATFLYNIEYAISLSTKCSNRHPFPSHIFYLIQHIHSISIIIRHYGYQL